jgi:hypothetical protein
MKKTLGILMVALAAAYGCGSDGGGAGNGGTGGTPTGGLCDQATAVNPCTGQCAFEPPSDINCTTACQNIATVCASGCTDQCTGLESDPTRCGAACEGVKGLQCTNLVFGCYGENNTCDGVGNCVANGG